MSTLRHLIRQGDGYIAYCPCGHKGRVDLYELAVRFGPEAYPLAPQIIPMLRCSRCGLRGRRRDSQGSAIEIRVDMGHRPATVWVGGRRL